MADVIVRSREKMVIEGKMEMLHNETVPVNFFQNNFMDYAISKILQQDVTYTILAIRGAQPNGHAIGIHNEKGKVHIFDPNFFVLECGSKTDLPGELKEAFLTIDHCYQGRFNKSFHLDVFY